MRKHLGVLAGVVALCAMSWAQAPAPTPAPDQTQTPAAPAETPPPTTDQQPSATPAATPIPTAPTTTATVAPERPYPRLEVFAGYSHAEAGPFNAGHWAGLNGWDASFGLNVTSWIGLVVDGGQYFGTAKIPTATPAPFPPSLNLPDPTFSVDTKEYNIVFGVQFARRKYEKWTPIANVFYGHDGIRGIATPISGPKVTEVGTGPAFIAGAGADYKINERFAMRFKADYLRTSTDFSSVGKQKQDNFRFSIGLVIRNVHKKKRKLEDETTPEP